MCYVSKNNQVLEQSAMKEICTAVVKLEVMIIFTSVLYNIHTGFKLTFQKCIAKILCQKWGWGQ